MISIVVNTEIKKRRGLPYVIDIHFINYSNLLFGICLLILLHDMTWLVYRDLPSDANVARKMRATQR